MIPVLGLLVAVLVVALTPVIQWYISYWKQNKGLEKIPGPKPYPIIGNTNLVGKTTTDLLKSFMKLQEDYGTFYKLWMGSRLVLMVNKPEYLENLLSSTVHIAKSDGYDLFRPWLGDGVLVSTGQKWKSRRKMITPTFHFKILEEFMTIFNKQVNIFLDNVTNELKQNPEESVNILYFTNLCGLDVICETAFGTSIKAQLRENPKYVSAVTTYLEIFTLRFFSGWLRNPVIFRFSKMYPKYKETLKILHDFTQNVISDRREHYKRKGKMEGEDGVKIKAALLDMLLEVSNNGETLTDEEIRNEVDTFMFEGHDTSSVAMCFTLYALAQNPKVQQKLYEELVEVLGRDSKCEITLSQINDLKYFDIVIKEVLRIYQPVPLIERRTETDWVVDGIKIPKDTTLSIFLYGMNHNPDVWQDPEKFDPERFLPEKMSARHNYAYTPFSAGPRNCIGQKFALYEIKTFVAKVLLQFQIDLDPNFTPQIGMCSVLKSMNGFQMKVKQRN